MTKVLLVEDDNNLREIYEARLAAEGYEISTAKDGEDALAVAKQVKPDLIISDVMMPRISGFEMLDILRNTDGLKHTKVIMLTALGQADDKSRADSLGADRYLVKSQVTLEDIVKAADELLNPEATAPTTDAQVPAPDTSTATAAPMPSPNTESVTATPTPQPASESAVPPLATPPADTALPVTTPTEPTAAAPDNFANTPAASVTEPMQSTSTTAPVVNNTASMPVTDTTPSGTTPTAVQPAPLDPVPAPDVTGGQDDEPLIQMPPQPVGNETVAVTTSQAQSTDQENNAVNQQIENFVNSAPAATPSEPLTPEAPQPVATPQANDPITGNDNANNDAVIKAAIDNLATDTDQTAPAPAATPSEPLTPEAPQPENPTPAEPAEPSTTQISGKKVITPLNDLNADSDNLQTLLAQEEMKENLEKGTTGTPVVGDDAPSASPAPAPAATPSEPLTPDNPTPPATPQSPPPGGVFTPNENGSANENAL